MFGPQSERLGMACGWDQIAGGSIDQDSLASSPRLDLSREEIHLRRHLPANVPTANANFRQQGATAYSYANLDLIG
jgi:hypothetical protein